MENLPRLQVLEKAGAKGLWKRFKNATDPNIPPRTIPITTRAASTSRSPDLTRLQMDVKYLTDIPTYHVPMRQHDLPRFQYTLRDESTGALFLAYATELSKTDATNCTAAATALFSPTQTPPAPGQHLYGTPAAQCLADRQPSWIACDDFAKRCRAGCQGD